MTPNPAVRLLPSSPGVYRFRDARSRVLYVGRAVDLRRRVGSYWWDLRDRAHLTLMVARIARIEAVDCDSAHEAAWLERNLLEHTLPYWNRTRGGEETPTYLRLDPRPAAPGVRAVHVPAAAPGIVHFGPYLGGDKVRLALSGRPDDRRVRAGNGQRPWRPSQDQCGVGSPAGTSESVGE